MKFFIKVLFIICFFSISLLAATDVLKLTNIVNVKDENRIIVSLDTTILNDLENIDTVKININENSSIKFKKKKFKKRKNGTIKWVGKNKKTKSKVVLTYKNNILYGRITVDKDIYKIKPKRNSKSKYIVFKQDKSKALKTDEGGIVYKSKRILAENNNITSQNEEAILNESIQELITSEDIVNGNITQIDIIIAYTQQFLDYYGEETEVRIQSLIDLANEGFSNSQTDVSLNLIHSQVYDSPFLSEDNNIGVALSNLSSDSNILALKRKYKADVVTLMRRYAGASSCGLGYLANSSSSSMNTSFNVVEDKQASEYGYYCSDLTLIHEIGHNFGAQHDRDHASNNGIFSYSFGYDIPGTFATIMSYDSPEINYFSSPNITYEGNVIGIADGNSNSADNARTIRETKFKIDNQFVEDLETGDTFNNSTITGVLSNQTDRDSFRIYLSGNVTFSNIYGLYMNIYDSNSYLVKSSSSSFSHDFESGYYDVILAGDNDETGYYYYITNRSYSISVQMENVAPIAQAGDNQIVVFGTNVTLDGSSSNDSDGSIVSYEWKEGSTILSTLQSFTKSDFSVGTHNITLTVIDDDGATSTDTVVITVNEVITYSWIVGEWGICQGSCGTDKATQTRTVECQSSNGNIVDDSNCSETKPGTTQTCTSSICQAPKANAGNDQTVSFGNSVTLDATASSDSDGSIVSYEWKEGNTILSNQSIFTKSDFTIGTHTITLSVTDSDGLTSTDIVTITINDTYSWNIGEWGTCQGECGTNNATQTRIVQCQSSQGIVVSDSACITKPATTQACTESLCNVAPIANAGTDQTVIQGNSVTLNGSSSNDSDGSIVSYEWKEGSTILSTLQSFTKSDFSVGTHNITLTVIDDDGASSTDTVVITVNALILDTDKDGIPDSTDTDDDNDGISDEKETEIGTDPLVDDKNLDNDNDGYSNYDEYMIGSDMDDDQSQIFTTNISQGWNLISFAANDVELIIDDMSDNPITTIHTISGINYQSWDKYVQIDNPISNIQSAKAYFIKSSSEFELKYAGTVGISPINISTLTKGWYMLGNVSISDIDTFLSENQNVKIIYTFKDGKYYAKTLSSDVNSDLEKSGIMSVDSIEKNEGIILKVE